MKIRSATIVRNILNHILQFLYKHYSSKTRSYTYNNLKIKIYPGVFPPRFFHSSQLLIKYLSDQDLKNQSFLELGAGSGLISLFAKKKGGHVTALDISQVVVKNVRENAALNDLQLQIIQSDLFENIRVQTFNWILINPPFYPRQPHSDSDFAWFCGKNFEYFKKLFTQLSRYTNNKSKVVMVLSDTAPINEIEKIARDNNYCLNKIMSQNYLLETVYLFMISVKQPK